MCVCLFKLKTDWLRIRYLILRLHLVRILPNSNAGTQLVIFGLYSRDEANFIVGLCVVLPVLTLCMDYFYSRNKDVKFVCGHGC